MEQQVISDQIMVQFKYLDLISHLLVPMVVHPLVPMVHHRHHHRLHMVQVHQAHHMVQVHHLVVAMIFGEIHNQLTQIDRQHIQTHIIQMSIMYIICYLWIQQRLAAIQMHQFCLK